VISTLSHLIDWIYPPACVACRVLLPLNESRRFFCARCEGLFDAISEPICGRCGAPSTGDIRSLPHILSKPDAASCATQYNSSYNPGVEPENNFATDTLPSPAACPSCAGKTFLFEKNFASFIYDDLLRELLHEIKFRDNKRVAAALGHIWAANCLNFPENISEYTLVPMPMHPKKQRERGFNQADLLAAPLAAALKIPVSKVLRRTVDTPPQSEIHPSQRAENVRGVFEVCKKFQTNEKKFILADDIFTTGASLNECVRVLIKSGAKQVLCMTLAISVKN